MSSLFTARAIYYRQKKGFDHSKALLSVVVQKMVNSEKSGVMFTINPIKGDKNIVIEAVWGLGEGIVSGKIKPDHYVVDSDLDNFRIVDMEVSNKKTAIIRDEKGHNKEITLKEEMANSQVLTNHELKILSQYGKQLEEHYGKPQDIEFAVDKSVFIVQSRPITTVFKERNDEKASGKMLLTGKGASPGISSGKVKIVHGLDELEKVKDGDVMVTEMTNPDMVVAMQRAAGIVTDEGGVTCFSGDTKVLTTKGFMNIQEVSELINNRINIGILTYDCRNMKPIWKRVLSAAHRKREAIRITVSQTGKVEDNSLDLTPDHKMITFDKRNLIKKEIKKILEEEECVCLIEKLPESTRFNNDKLSYLLGALLSDGNIQINYYSTGNPRRGRITFTQKDIPEKDEFTRTVREYFEECFGNSFKDGREKTSHSYIRGRLIQGVAMDYICNNLEVAQKILKISQNLDSFILGIDESSSLNFLAGLIDGDGCFLNNRLHIYIGKENVLKGTILSCLNAGIFPQVTTNRGIYHVQILERISDILNYTKRVKGNTTDKMQGTKLFSAKQILGDIIDQVNYKGRIKPYVQNNLLIDSRKIEKYLLDIATEKQKIELTKIINSNLKMQRVRKISDIGKTEVYNLEVEADNELDHNFVVFTKKYTPLVVSNSHAAIVSREMGIPCVVGTGDATKKLKDGDEITVDGNSGKVFEGKGKTMLKVIEPIVQTRTQIKVIVDLPDYAERAARSKVKSVGLTRMEGIIAEGGKHPMKFVKEKNMKPYTKIIYSGIKKISHYFDEMWIRTSDIRSDEYQHLEGAPQKVEGNPMLGNHGVRFSLKHKDIMSAEIEAIKKVAEENPHKKFGVMVPQVISLQEVQETKRIAAELGIPKNVVVGIMVETPAAVQIIEDICKEGINFISFGTNDLTQFTLALDRNNEDVQDLYTEMHPAVLRSLSHVIRTCKKYGVKTSICGQAASREEMAKFLVSEGINSLSVNADAARKISEVVAKVENEMAGVVEYEGEHTIEEARDEEKHLVVNNVPKRKIEIESEDIEDVILKELDENGNEYSPGSLNVNEKHDIPRLNDAIHLNEEEVKEEEVIDEENIDRDNVLSSEWTGEDP